MKRTEILRAAGTIVSGMKTHSNLPFTHVVMGAVLLALTAARTLGRAFAKARAWTRKKRRTRAEVTAAAQVHAITCRQVLVPTLGDAWSTEWIPLGWTDNTLSVPQSAESLAELYQSLTAHLTDHPELGSEKHKVTAADCQKYLDALERAIGDVGEARRLQRIAREDRDTADLRLSEKTRAVLTELGLIIPANDPRWMDFVKQVPTDETRPDAVEDLAVDGGAPGELDADWEPSLRADRYLVHVKIEGEDQDFRRLMTVQDEAATLTGLPPGKRVKVRVVAANSAGESAPGEEVSVTVPAVAKAA